MYAHIFIYIFIYVYMMITQSCRDDVFLRFNVSPVHTDDGRSNARKSRVITCVNKDD